MNEAQGLVVRRRRSRQEVEQVVAEYETSGLSRIEFCRERGVALSTLGRYRSRQQRQAPAGMAVEVCGRAPAPMTAGGSALAVVLRRLMKEGRLRMMRWHAITHVPIV